jgi:hypothetical protein
VLGIVWGMPVIACPLPVVVDVEGVGGVMVGMVGSAVGARVPAMGAVLIIGTAATELIIGTAAAELTPRLPISVEARGIPVPGMPPGVVGEAGVDEAAILAEPEPHMPDMPEVSIVVDVVGIPEPVDIPYVDAVGVAMLPEAVAGAADAVLTDMPPPSKTAVDPYIVDGDVAVVVHPMLPTALPTAVEPVYIGLTPAD